MLARREAELIVSNDPAMFAAAGETVATPAAGVNEWTLVRLDARAQTLDPVARRLEPTCWQTEPCAPDAAPPTDILTNLSGLLRATGKAWQITRSSRATPGRRREEIEVRVTD